ncbi:MAG TPA: DUF6089 family protein [Bacteroidia bacterium]|nr:DUF6089 family protein [Bacteroidia bacterium]
MKRTLTLAILFATAVNLAGQQTNEIGIFLGGSYYTGDLNPSGHLNSLTRPAAGLVYRHNFNNRLALAGSLLFGSIQGIDARSSSYEQQQRNLSFRSNLYELAGRWEFNFIEYKIGDDRHQFTPFMFLGGALYYFDPKASFGNQWVPLQPLKTEGQTKPYMRYQVSIPFGAGIRANLAKNIGLVIEWGLRKTFTDYLDDVSTVYADPNILYANGGSIAVAIADRSGNAATNVGRQRGNPRTKDWYSFAGITLTFQLPGHNKPCIGIGL